VFKNSISFKLGLVITQIHVKCYNWVWLVWLPINGL